MPAAVLDISALESWLWEAACIIRGPIDAPKFKDYILPLIFLKRLSDVYEDDLERLGPSSRFVDQDHKLVRFYVPPGARWSYLQQQTTGLGELLTDAVRAVSRENPRLHGVIDIKDFNETAAGQRILSDDQLRALIQLLSQHRLGLKDVGPDFLGREFGWLGPAFGWRSASSAAIDVNQPILPQRVPPFLLGRRLGGAALSALR